MTPFYTLALKLFTRTQASQIQKGIEKYPETFNPRSWTPQELLNHALEETVDLTHYLVGLKVLLDDRDEEIKRLKAELALVRGVKPKYHPTEDWIKLEDVKQRIAPKKIHRCDNCSAVLGEIACTNEFGGSYCSGQCSEIGKHKHIENLKSTPPYFDPDDQH